MRAWKRCWVSDGVPRRRDLARPAAAIGLWRRSKGSRAAANECRCRRRGDEPGNFHTARFQTLPDRASAVAARPPFVAGSSFASMALHGTARALHYTAPRLSTAAENARSAAYLTPGCSTPGPGRLLCDGKACLSRERQVATKSTTVTVRTGRATMYHCSCQLPACLASTLANRAKR
jgi:hypothetical protein